MPTAIINGKKVEITGSVSGETLINEATGGNPNRRAVISEKDGNKRTIDPNEIYRPGDLKRDDGKPIEIRDMPDRIKGADYEPAGTFLKPRSELSKNLIRDQVYNLAALRFKNQSIDFDEDGAHSMVIPNFTLPKGWTPKTTPLMIVFPVEYPSLPPNGFYIDKNCVPPPDKAGHMYSRAYNDGFGSTTEQEQYLKKNNWLWYCAHVKRGSWTPARIRNLADWRNGDNLFDFFTLIDEVLNASE